MHIYVAIPDNLVHLPVLLAQSLPTFPCCLLPGVVVFCAVPPVLASSWQNDVDVPPFPSSTAAADDEQPPSAWDLKGHGSWEGSHVLPHTAEHNKRLLPHQDGEEGEDQKDSLLWPLLPFSVAEPSCVDNTCTFPSALES